MRLVDEGEDSFPPDAGKHGRRRGDRMIVKCKNEPGTVIIQPPDHANTRVMVLIDGRWLGGRSHVRAMQSQVGSATFRVASDYNRPQMRSCAQLRGITCTGNLCL